MNPLMIAGGVAALFAVIGGLQTWRLGNAQEEVGELRAKMEVQIAETRQAVDVNTALNTNIDELATKIAAMVEGRRLEREEQDRVLAARDEDIAAATAIARRLEGERDEIFRRDLGCAEMGDIRVDLVCPAIAEQLRELSGRGTRSSRDPDSGGASGGGEAPASTVHPPPILSSANW